MFHDIDNYGFNVSMTSPSIQFQILNHGIYDKKYGGNVEIQILV